MTWKIPWNEIVLMGNLERSAVGNKFGSRLSIGRNSLNVRITLLLHNLPFQLK